MRTMRSILPEFACGAVFVAVSATGEVMAQADATPKPVTPAAAETETKPAAETVPATEATPAPASGAEAVAPGKEGMVAEIKKHAEICSAAQLSMDFDKILPYVPKKMLEMIGGEDVLKTRVAQGNAELHRRGVKIDSAVIGTPAAPQEFDGVLVSLVPMTTNLTTPQGKLVSTSHMIAISEDKGASWDFLDTATVNEEKLGTLYPALKGKVKIPGATARKAEK